LPAFAGPATRVRPNLPSVDRAPDGFSSRFRSHRPFRPCPYSGLSTCPQRTRRLWVDCGKGGGNSHGSVRPSSIAAMASLRSAAMAEKTGCAEPRPRRSSAGDRDGRQHGRASCPRSRRTGRRLSNRDARRYTSRAAPRLCSRRLPCRSYRKRGRFS